MKQHLISLLSNNNSFYKDNTNLKTFVGVIENNRLVPWIEKVYLARRSNLSGEPKANPINYGAEPDKLSQSTAPTYYSVYPVTF